MQASPRVYPLSSGTNQASRRLMVRGGPYMKTSSPLDAVKIASPCSAEWDQMIGDDRSRYCGQCKLNVYSFSGMSGSEVEEFLLAAEGRVCVRLFERADGTMITENCPVGLAAVRLRVRRYATAAAS